MKIAVFGCSWSAGISTLSDQNGKVLNWPYFLAKKTGWTIENYALGGSCIRWSLNNLISFLKEKKDYYIIFQVTSPYRLTYNTPEYNYKNFRDNVFDNYYQYDATVRNCVLTYQAHYVNNKNWHKKHGIKIDKNVLNMYELMIRYYPDDYFNNDCLSTINYIKTLSNLTFTHCKSSTIDNDVFAIEDKFGKKFNKFLFDEGKHFNAEGLNYQADFIKGLIDNS
jgi:hypothetical protein